MFIFWVSHHGVNYDIFSSQGSKREIAPVQTKSQLIFFLSNFSNLQLTWNTITTTYQALCQARNFHKHNYFLSSSFFVPSFPQSFLFLFPNLLIILLHRMDFSYPSLITSDFLLRYSWWVNIRIARIAFLPPAATHPIPVLYTLPMLWGMLS